MKIVWRPMAEADRENIFDYIAQPPPWQQLSWMKNLKPGQKVPHATRNFTEPGVCAALVK